MSDGLKSHIRTWWPLLIGHLAALGAAWVAQRFGIHIDDAIAFEAVGFALSAGVYSAGRWLETRPQGWAQTAGRWLLSLGLDVGAPTYAGPKAPAVTARPGGDRADW